MSEHVAFLRDQADWADADEMPATAAKLRAAADELERLQVIVAWLDTTADSVPIVHEGPCYTPDGRLAYIEPFSTTPLACVKPEDLEGTTEWFDARNCFSTVEAQQAAEAAEGG